MWQRSHKSSEERKLELRLGPPGEESLIENIKRERDESPLPLGYFSTQKISTSDSTCYHRHNQYHAKAKASSVLQLPSSPQKRNAPVPVVGWPPIRSFRKNLASGSSSKQSSESHQQHQHVVPDKVAAGKKPIDNSGKSMFVKINMDGVPIGRKVDINAYDSYEKLSSAIDELFRGLLAEINLCHNVFPLGCSTQSDSSAVGNHKKQEGEKAIKGLLVGSGEYTLVYEDNEGDKMLVGDVPWHMFASTVKRLRVLKSSDLPAFTLGSKQNKTPHLTRQ
ncbi:auxin-responsive protein IAA26-like [Gastrolobium bilobum]|uniref:auxin-responsive protein IAA26-like n=1 Tax=Gastrolobium bilobum TaxID=150636 RepID=UPI002AB2BFDB|nr:auxin-responsive protein IAA26-like [Gastrolobium bilobum]XP_061358377.1 auxin-responsive protein IAA26-like [Gastrolobium bilobum]